MRLVIGGYVQGKLKYVLSSLQGKDCAVFNGTIPDLDEKVILHDKIIILDHFHLWVQNCILQGEHPEKEIECVLERYPDCIIISDEVGCGIVPMEAFDRIWRERLGRILENLAEQADEVDRVICGIGQRIK